jgi:hypothetical protein
MTRKTLSSIAAASAFVALSLTGPSFAQAIGPVPMSPLDPGFYVAHPDHTVPQAELQPYKDSGNPLEPTYQSRYDAPSNIFEPTAKELGNTGPIPQDLNNPLYPGYSRSIGRP